MEAEDLQTFFTNEMMKASEVETLVRQALEKDFKCRNNDNYLVDYIRQENPNTNVSTILRKRRFIQNTMGEWLPTDAKVLRKRRIKEQVLREYFTKRGEAHIIEEWKSEVFQI